MKFKREPLHTLCSSASPPSDNKWIIWVYIIHVGAKASRTYTIWELDAFRYTNQSDVIFFRSSWIIWMPYNFLFWSIEMRPATLTLKNLVQLYLYRTSLSVWAGQCQLLEQNQNTKFIISAKYNNKAQKNYENHTVPYRTRTGGWAFLVQCAAVSRKYSEIIVAPHLYDNWSSWSK